MATPYSGILRWNTFKSTDNSYWHTYTEPQRIEEEPSGQTNRAAIDAVNQVVIELIARGVQCIRDTARLVLKTPIRLIFERCHWKQLERASINGKMAFYSAVQLVSVPPKFLAALSALCISPFSQRKAKWIQDKSESWTRNIDGRMSKLEAQKEEGLKNASCKKEFLAYKKWVERIPAHRCRKNGAAL